MGEPVLDLSELIGLYKEDARHMVERMVAALSQWPEVQAGGPARQELRKLSHQLRGSGRTYGFRNVTCVGKAIENIMQRLDKKTLSADERVRESIRKKVARLSDVFCCVERESDG